MGHEIGEVIRVAVVDDDEILLHGIHAWLCHGNPRPDGPTDGLEIRVVRTAKSVTDLLRPSANGTSPGHSPTANSASLGGHTPLGSHAPLAGSAALGVQGPTGRPAPIVGTASVAGAIPTGGTPGRRNNGVTRPVDQLRAGVPPMRERPHSEELRLAPVALLDLRLRDGRRVTDNVRALIDGGYAVVTCSTIDDAGLVHEAGRAGALSYVRKSREAGEMRHALAAAARGERHVSQSHAALIQRARSYGVPELSGQEREALRLYASGLTMSSVARRLNVKQGTAKSYLDRVRDKYEQAGRAARTKLELRDRAVEDGVLSSPRLE